MRIEGYAAVAVISPSGSQPAPVSHPATTVPPLHAAEVSELSPQEKLRLLIEERQSAVQENGELLTPQGELGQHIDLRV